VDFFTDNTYLLSTQGAGAALRVLADLFSPVMGGVYFGEAIAMVTIELGLAASSDCPGAAPAEPDDGSTFMEGMLCSLIISSSAAPSTLRFECLGFEELPK
jgi:hypothetical protein